jgi:hypothetical protein
LDKSTANNPFKYQIPKYTRTPGSTYSVTFSFYIPKAGDTYTSDELLNTLTQEYFILSSELIVYVMGGNRLHGYTAPLELEGFVQDIDQDPDSVSASSISYTWECTDMKTGNPC